MQLAVIDNDKQQSSVWKTILPALVTFVFFLGFSLFWYKEIGSKPYLICALTGTLLATALVACYSLGVFSRDKAKTIGFGAVLTVSCLIFAFALPPFSEPDSGHHYYSTYWLSNVVLGKADIHNGSDVEVRAADAEFASYFFEKSVTDNIFTIQRASYDAVSEADKLPAHNDYTPQVEHWGFSFSSENVPAKIGTVVGFTLGRLVNASPLVLYYMGRIGTCLYFVLLVMLAYRFMPKHKNAIIVTSLLPMTLHLAGSYSYDAGIVGIAMLLFSLIYNAIEGSGKLSAGHLCAIGALAVVLAPCKLVYSLIMLTVFWIPSSRFTSKKTEWLFKGLVLLSAFVAVVLIRFASIASLAAEPSGNSSDGPMYYTLNDVLTRPVYTLKLFVRTLTVYGGVYAETMLGNRLGWLQDSLRAPELITLGYWIVLIFSAQRKDDEAKPTALIFRIELIGIFFASLAVLMLVMFIGWTLNDDVIVQGVQGRYLLPVLPLFLVGICSKHIVVGRYGTVQWAFTATSLLNIFYLMWFVVHALVL